MIIYKLKRAASKLLVELQLLFSNESAECNVCGKKSLKFTDTSWHIRSMCPHCGSGIRHRLIVAALQNLDALLLQKVISEKKVLHFAPDACLVPLLRQHAGEYTTADLGAQGYTYSSINLQLDISNMGSVANNSYHCVIANDVLEHVPNHKDAMCEVYRILQTGGFFISTVPQKDFLEKTFEDPAITDPKEREKLFGQNDHLRIYGSDYKQMLEQAGFNVTVVNESSFSPELVKKQVLFPVQKSSHPLATNYRRIYFAQK